jgi:hypothetical protein
MPKSLSSFIEVIRLANLWNSGAADRIPSIHSFGEPHNGIKYPLTGILGCYLLLTPGCYSAVSELSKNAPPERLPFCCGFADKQTTQKWFSSHLRAAKALSVQGRPQWLLQRRSVFGQPSASKAEYSFAVGLRRISVWQVRPGSVRSSYLGRQTLIY